MSILRLGRSVTKRGRLVLAGLILASALALPLIWASSVPAGTFVTVPVSVSIWTLPTTLGLQARATVAVGCDDSLAIAADGSLWAWGNGGYGELGDGATDHRVLPTQIGTGTDWVAVSAGDYHSLALKSDGSLWAWGLNDHGQLGDGTTSNRHVPTRIGTGTDWVAIAGGGDHSLALKSDGSLWSWGWNTYGQVGDGSSTDRLVPIHIGGDTNWVAVSAGAYQSLALKSDGSLWAWGGNALGELGDGSSTDRLAPIRIGTGTVWVAIAAGAGHSLALKSDGSLWAWGDNLHGQLGDGTTTVRFVPTYIGRKGNNWTAISGGGWHSLALKADGSVWAWGNNGYGQLGDGTTTNRLLPTRIGTGTTGAAVAAGERHSLCLAKAGILWSCGHNVWGELGDGTTTERHSPVQVLMGLKVASFQGAISTTTTTTITTSTTSTTSTTLASGSTTTTLVSGMSFSDISSSPYKVAIEALAAAGSVTGFSDGTFRPDALVTRQQFAKMVVKAMGLTVTGSEVCPFTDVVAQTGSDPFYPSKYVAVCASHGITTGKTATTFDPTDDITRQQLITMVVRADMLAVPPPSYTPSFTPAQFSLAEHYQNARKAAYAGLLDGLQGVGPVFDFTASGTRGECAQILYNLSKR